MNFRSLLTLCALLLCVSLTAQSVPERAGNRAKNRAENRANNNLDRKVDRAVDDAFNAVGNLFKKKNKKKKNQQNQPAQTGKQDKPTTDQSDDDSGAAAMDMLSKMMGGGKDWEPYTNPVTFSLDMTVVEQKRNGKSDTQRMSLGATTDRFAMIMNGEGSERNQMILNTQNGKTTMITTDKKGQTTGYELRIPSMAGAVGDEIDEMDMTRYSFEKTGQRRTIDGYDCELIIMKDRDSDMVSEAWVTKDIELDASEVFGGLAKSFGAKAPKMAGDQAPYEGFPIESKMTQNGKVYTTTFSNIRFGAGNIDPKLLSTDGVQIQQMGF